MQEDNQNVTIDAKIFDCFASSDRATKAITKILSKKYDTDSWNILIKEAIGKNIEEVEPFYEQLMSTFPYCARFWKTYIEHEMRFKRYDKVSKLFQRSLEDILSVDLYKCYLNFVREVKANEPDLIYKAFRFTLDRVGTDPCALSIYNDYIQFLKEREVDGSYLDSQKITAVRKAYQEGIVNPMFQIESLWKEYINFEQSVDQRIAEKMVQDRSKDHMSARRVAKEWEVTIRGLDRTSPALPATNSQEEHRQIEIWNRYIQWEKSDPLNIKNNSIIVKRVSYAYKQYLLSFCHHPNVWNDYASFINDQIQDTKNKDLEMKNKLLKEIVSLFDKAIKGTMKNNLLIHFAYADFEEARNDKKKALEIYNGLIDDIKKEDKDATSNDNKEEKRTSPDVTLVYIRMLRFGRRNKIGFIPSKSNIYKRASEDDRCTHHIYTATALMEYHCTKDKRRALEIFEKGVKKFSSCSDYVLSYINFTKSLNEEHNTRALFENVLKTYPLQPKETVEIWDSYLEFEAAVGGLTNISEVEKRRKAALEKIVSEYTKSLWVIDKYKFQDLTPFAMIKSELEQPVSVHISTNVSNHHNFLNNNPVDNSNSSIVMPDLNQMLPFKPIMNQPIPGGVFAPPPAIANLMSRLPQQGFWGPYVDIDQLSDIVRSTDFEKLFNNLYKRRTKKPKLE